MEHLGDITKLSGYTIPTVDVITGGSPCQDLSVAGKQVGLAGERSGLFFEQIRLVKEMRENDIKAGRTSSDIRPRYMVWENVAGAFSSNKGADFRQVLQEIIGIVCENAPVLPKADKWNHAGIIYDDMGRWSIAWRLHDAQYWGVPQRRRRIALVADFGGLTAGEILFKPESLSGNTEQSGTARKDIARTSDESVGQTGGDICLNDQGGSMIKVSHGITFTLRAEEHGHQPYVMQSFGDYKECDSASALKQRDYKDATDLVVDDVYCLQGNGIDRANTAGCNGKGWRKDKSYTLNTIDRPAVYDARGLGNGDIVPTIVGDHQNRVAYYTAICVDQGGGKTGCNHYVEKSPTLTCTHGGEPAVLEPVYGLDRASFNQGINAKYDFSIEKDKVGCQTSKGPGAVCYKAVRRLTPLECERLQGYPDGWTDIGDWEDSKGKIHKLSDTARYKALGNSIALPFWQYMANNICEQYNRQITLGSLFDGIGGFPLVFERAGAKAVWASEIEEYPMAVTRKRFP